MATTGVHGKVALVTGAGSGIGRETAEALAGEGARVVATDLDLERARETCRGLGGGAIALEMNVSERESVEHSVAIASGKTGGIDFVVNNAGISIRGAIDEISEDTWDQGFATNLKSIYLVSKAVWSDFLHKGAGAIVNVASISGIWAAPKDAAYSASKAGAIMLTKCMALDGAAAGIRVNCVCPGWIDTPMVDRIFERMEHPAEMRKAAERLHPLGNLGAPRDIASAIVYLLSDEARWVTGSALVVDGGLTCGLSPRWMERL